MNLKGKKLNCTGVEHFFIALSIKEALHSSVKSALIWKCDFFCSGSDDLAGLADFILPLQISSLGLEWYLHIDGHKDMVIVSLYFCA